MNIVAPDRASAQVLSYIRADPRIAGQSPERIDLTIEKRCGFLRLVAPSGHAVEGSASHILSELHRLHFDVTRAEFPGSPLIHGGAVTTSTGHSVFVGEKGAGKTTLLVHLAALGWPVTGDEHMIVEGDGGIPRPRSLRIKPGTLPYLTPPARALILDSPRTEDWHGSSVYAVEPSAFGREWIIGSRPIRHIFLLRANHGGRSSVRPLTSVRALELLLPNVVLPETQRPRALAWLRDTVYNCGCWEIRNGSLEESTRILHEILPNSEVNPTPD
jgi:energy-coupling factor transporter ATP-binding protein EcfA2